VLDCSSGPQGSAEHVIELDLLKHQLESLREEKTQLRNDVSDERDRADIAESAHEREVASTDELLQGLRNHIDDIANHLGLPDDDDELKQKIWQVCQWARIHISVMYQESLAELARRLGFALRLNPNHNLDQPDHDNAVTTFLDGFVEDATTVFQRLNNDVDAEQRRTFNIRAAWIQALKTLGDKAANTITLMEAHSTAFQDLCGEVQNGCISLTGPGMVLERLIAVIDAQEKNTSEQARRIKSLERRLELSMKMLEDAETLLKQVMATVGS
jgi:hypothetical protein